MVAVCQPPAGQARADEFLLGRDIAPERRVRIGPDDDHCLGGGRIGIGTQPGHDSAGHRIHGHPVRFDSGRGRHGEVGRVGAEVGAELVFRSECQPAGRRVQAVGADHQVEFRGGPRREVHPDAVAVFTQVANPFPVPVVDARITGGTGGIGDRIQQNLVQIAAGYLDFGDRAVAAEEVRGHTDYLLSCGIDMQHAAFVEPVPVDSGHQAHPLGDGPAGPAQVDGLTAGAGSGCTFDHGGPDPGSGQLQGDGVAGDSAAGDQHSGGGGTGACGHRFLADFLLECLRQMSNTSVERLSRTIV